KSKSILLNLTTDNNTQTTIHTDSTTYLHHEEEEGGSLGAHDPVGAVAAAEEERAEVQHVAIVGVHKERLAKLLQQVLHDGEPVMRQEASLARFGPPDALPQHEGLELVRVEQLVQHAEELAGTRRQSWTAWGGNPEMTARDEADS